DIGIAAGLTMSIQDTVGSEIAFAAILHLGQTVPLKNLRCVLDVRGMVSRSTGVIDVDLTEGGVRAPENPGLGVTPDLNVLGEPVAHWS
ncbi:MAG: mandelate racemase, partial [Pseudomonadota bacterium]